MEDVVDVKGVALNVEVEPEVAGAEAVEGLLGAAEAAERFAGVGEIRGLEGREGIDGVELGEGIEPVELVHRLGRERDLVHRIRSRAGGGPGSGPSGAPGSRRREGAGNAIPADQREAGA